MKHTNLLRGAAVLAVAALLGACEGSTDVPNYNAQSYTDLNGANLGKAEVRQLMYGEADLFRQARSSNYVTFSESMARDAYRLDPNENRYVTEFLSNTPDPSAFSGGGAFTTFYRTVLAGDVIVRNLATTTSDNLTDDEKLAIRGYANTFKAMALYSVLETRDTLGIPIDAYPPPAKPAPIICKTQALAYISALLDSAATDLKNGATKYPFTLPEAFNQFDSGLNSPAGVRQLNRAFKAKVEIARALDHQNPTGATGFQNALTALSESFISDNPADFNKGYYMTYSTAGGDLQNQYTTDSKIYVNPKVVDSAQAGDKRLAAKVRAVPSATVSGFTSAYGFVNGKASDPTVPFPIIRDEELILLRAQAEIGLNNLPAALADLNLVRVNSGGLAPYASLANQADAINKLLYEKRYSLLFESAQRLVDLRAYSRLNNTYFAPESPTDPYNAVLPIPANEVNYRGGPAGAVCTTELPTGTTSGT